MGGQRRGLREVQLKRAKRAQKRASRKSGASSVADNAAAGKLLDAEERKEQEIKSKYGGSSETAGEKDGEGESIPKTDVGVEKAESLCNAENTIISRTEDMNGSSKLEETSKVEDSSKSSKVEDSSNSLKVDSSKSSKLEVASQSL